MRSCNQYYQTYQQSSYTRKPTAPCCGGGEYVPPRKNGGNWCDLDNDFSCHQNGGFPIWDKEECEKDFKPTYFTGPVTLPLYEYEEEHRKPCNNRCPKQKKHEPCAWMAFGAVIYKDSNKHHW